MPCLFPSYLPLREFTADQSTFSCDPDDPCSGTFGIKVSICELECVDNKHPGHAVLSVNSDGVFDISSE